MEPPAIVLINTSHQEPKPPGATVVNRSHLQGQPPGEVLRDISGFQAGSDIMWVIAPRIAVVKLNWRHKEVKEGVQYWTGPCCMATCLWLHQIYDLTEYYILCWSYVLQKRRTYINATSMWVVESETSYPPPASPHIQLIILTRS